MLSVNEQTRARKEGQDAEELYALFADVGHVSKSLFRLAHKLASNPHVFASRSRTFAGPAGSPSWRAEGSSGCTHWPRSHRTTHCG